MTQPCKFNIFDVLALIQEYRTSPNITQVENPLVLRFYLCETVQLSLHLLFSPGQFFLFTVFEDIGEKVMMGELNNKLNYSYMLICTLSHELYTPLNHLQAGIDQLLSYGTKKPATTLEEVQEELLILKYIEQGLHLFVQNILDFARHINRTLTISCQTFSLFEAVKEMTNLFRIKAKKKRIKFEIDCPETVLNTDKDKLLGVLFLFLDNSIKHTNSGGISLNVRDGRTEDFIQFEIIDTGTGIEEEDLDKLRIILNNPFANVRTGQSAGIGIGFRVAQVLIMYLTEGDMTLEIRSIKGLGTTICFDVLKRGRQINSQKIQVAHLKTVVANDKLDQSEIKFGVERSMFHSRQMDGEDNDNSHLRPIGLRPDRSRFISSQSIQQLDVIQEKGEDGTGRSRDLKKKQRKLITATIYVQNGLDAAAGREQPKTIQREDESFVVSKMYDFGLISPGEEIVDQNEQSRPENTKLAMVVDDEILNAEFLQANLECFGLEVFVAYDGEQAIEFCMKCLTYNKKIDIIFMDYSMPSMNGDVCTTKLRSSRFNPILRDTPIIGLTAHRDELVAQACMEAGMSKVVYKPFSFDQAKKILQEYRLAAEDPKN